jgi:hypothetical protein
MACRLKQGPQKTKAFRDLRISHQFSERELMTAASAFRVGFLREKIGAQEAQVLGRRMYQAVNKWLVGRGGKPRYKGKSRGLHSLECKDMNGDLRVAKDARGLQWGRDLLIPFALDRPDPCQVYALEQVKAGKLLYCRIVRTKVKSRWAYRGQLIMAGTPLSKYEVGNQKVGLDLGPSKIAIVSDKIAVKETLGAGLKDASQELRRLQRRLDRQHRFGSAGCFDAQGRHVPGGCEWKARSRRAKQTQEQMADLWRRLSEHRKSLHGNLANRILAQGVDVKAEKLSYASLQKNYGRSVNRRAPGGFFEILSRKAASAGGQMTEINTYTTALSQTCVCGRQAKKKLSQRRHDCPQCKLKTDRDILPAFLTRHVDTSGVTHRLVFSTARLELLSRHDIDGWSESGLKNARVPAATRLVGQGETPWSASAISSRITADAHVGEAA